MKLILIVTALFFALGLAFFAGDIYGSWRTYWMAHDEFLGRCINASHNPFDDMWCKYFVGDIKGRQ